jgi:hypothetical protein
MVRLVIQTSQRDSKSKMRAPITNLIWLAGIPNKKAHCYQMWEIEKKTKPLMVGLSQQVSTLSNQAHSIV